MELSPRGWTGRQPAAPSLADLTETLNRPAQKGLYQQVQAGLIKADHGRVVLIKLGLEFAYGPGQAGAPAVECEGQHGSCGRMIEEEIPWSGTIGNQDLSGPVTMLAKMCQGQHCIVISGSGNGHFLETGEEFFRILSHLPADNQFRAQVSPQLYQAMYFHGNQHEYGPPCQPVRRTIITVLFTGGTGCIFR